MHASFIATVYRYIPDCFMALVLDVVISPPCMSVAPLDLAPDWPLVAPVPAAIKVVDLVVGASVLVREPVLVGESVLVGAPVY